MKFCDRNGCNAILKSQIENNELIFKCAICSEVYPSDPTDTLLVNDTIRENDSLYKHEMYIRNAQYDTISELIEKKCNNSKCDETIVRVIKIDKNGQAMFICPKCGTRFV